MPTADDDVQVDSAFGPTRTSSKRRASRSVAAGVRRKRSSRRGGKRRCATRRRLLHRFSFQFPRPSPRARVMNNCAARERAHLPACL